MVNLSKIDELKVFFNELDEFQSLTHMYLKNKNMTKKEKEHGEQLFKEIGRKAGSLGPLITELTGLKTVDVHGKEHDMWVIALRIPQDNLAHSALSFCLQATLRAIGRLEEDINIGIRDKQGNVIEKPLEAPKTNEKPPLGYKTPTKE